MSCYGVCMSPQTPWSRYIDATSNGDLNTVIAQKVRVDPATVGRWRTGAIDPKPRQVVEYARAYGLSPLSGLIAAGYITEQEVGVKVFVPDITLSDFTVTALAEELASRLRDHQSGRTVTDLFPTTTTIGDDKAHVTISA